MAVPAAGQHVQQLAAEEHKLGLLSARIALRIPIRKFVIPNLARLLAGTEVLAAGRLVQLLAAAERKPGP